MLRQSDKINEILETVKELQPLPVNITRVLHATEEPETTATKLSEFIGLDQALAANVLHLANAASLGFGPPCSTLTDSVMRLGFKRIRTIVLGIGASNPLTQRLRGYRLGEGQLWTHSIATATTAQWLANYFHYPQTEEAYVAGLLHDIGKLLLDQFIMLDYQQILYSVQIQKKMLCDAEEQLIGINHAKVGGLMAEKWNFPGILIEAISCHHAPGNAYDQPILAAITNIANAICAKGVGNLDPYGRVVNDESLRILNIKNEIIPKLEEKLKQYLEI